VKVQKKNTFISRQDCANKYSMDKKAVRKIQDDILKAALPSVAFDGWTMALLEDAARQAGYESAMVGAVFPGGLIGALEHFSLMMDGEMMARLKDVDPESLRIRDRVRTAVFERFKALQPHKEALRRSMMFWAVPTRKPRAAKMVWHTADIIWDWAGDTATDYNRYTKRGLLTGIIVSTTFAFLDDNEDSELQATQDFLDRRIENVMTVGNWIRKAGLRKEAGR